MKWFVFLTDFVYLTSDVFQDGWRGWERNVKITLCVRMWIRKPPLISSFPRSSVYNHSKNIRDWLYFSCTYYGKSSISIFPKSYVVRQLMRRLVYTSLLLIITLLFTQICSTIEKSQILWIWLSAKFFFICYVFINSFEC